MYDGPNFNPNTGDDTSGIYDAETYAGAYERAEVDVWELDNPDNVSFVSDDEGYNER